MDFTDLIYQLFNDLKLNVNVADQKIKTELNGMKNKLEKISTDIIIHEDWIIKIEDTFKYIEAAIYENRQFIREEGEVLPIEKIKKVSKASVSNLARHSEYITHVPEDGGDVIPDKLYTVEKDTDFSVYENKFLYLLLETLRGFVSLEIEGINSVIESNYSVLDLSKSNRLQGTDNKIKINYEGKRNFEAEVDESLKKMIERVYNIEARISSLLQMNLMVEMSKYPLISSNITKTNVLRMNENFKACVELYDFISHYDDLGYDTVLHKSTVNLTDEEKLELEISLYMLETLCFKDSNGLTESFKTKYDEYKKTLDEEAIKARDKRIDELKEKMAKSGNTDIEYVILLEDKIEDLLLKTEKIKLLEEKNNELKRLNNEQALAITEKNKEIEALKLELELKNNSSTDLQAQIEELNKRNDLLRAQIEELENNDDKVNQFVESVRTENAKLNSIIDELKEELNNFENQELEKLNIKDSVIDEKNEEIDLLKAKLLTYGEGLKTDYTSKEDYDELERQYLKIKHIYDSEWKKTKKKIKKEFKEELKSKKKEDKTPLKEEKIEEVVTKEEIVEESINNDTDIVLDEAKVDSLENENVESNEQSIEEQLGPVLIDDSVVEEINEIKEDKGPVVVETEEIIEESNKEAVIEEAVEEKEEATEEPETMDLEPEENQAIDNDPVVVEAEEATADSVSDDTNEGPVVVDNEEALETESTENSDSAIVEETQNEEDNNKKEGE